MYSLLGFSFSLSIFVKVIFPDQFVSLFYLRNFLPSHNAMEGSIENKCFVLRFVSWCDGMKATAGMQTTVSHKPFFHPPKLSWQIDRDIAREKQYSTAAKQEER